MRKSVLKFIVVLLLSQLFLSLSLSASIAVGETPLESSALSYESHHPVIDGDKVVYLNSLGLTYPANVYLKTIGGGVPQLISTVKKAQTPAMADGRAVWEDLRNNSVGGTNTDIYSYNLPAGPEAAVETNGSTQLNPDTSGGRVVWSDNRNGDWDIYLKDTSGVVSRITSDTGDQLEPRIDGDLIVWADNRNGLDDVYLYNIATATETRLTDDPAKQNGPDISGRKIVWTDWRSTRNTYVYDLDNPVANGAVVDPSPYVQHSPRISGNRVVWTDWRNEAENSLPDYNSDIYAANLITSETIRITYNIWQQNSPDVSGNRIVWADARNGPWNIYMYEFGAPTGTISINNGAAYTNSSTVTLNLTTNGAAWMRFAETTAALAGAAYQPYASSAPFSLTGGDGQNVVYAQFRDAIGVESTPTISDSIGLDTGPPLDPAITTSTPAPGVWASDNTINVSWAGAADGGSGVDGYSVAWTQNSTGTPDATLDLQESAVSTTSAPLANGLWYFNLRTKDNAANWTSTVHAGPFMVDAAAPTNPSTATETAGAVSGAWQNTTGDPNFSWSGAGDTGGSGVKGYYYYWGASPTGAPTTWTASPAFDAPAVPSPSTYYLRVKTEDNAGNQSGIATLFTFRYDGSAPVDPTITTSTPAPAVWANDNTVNVNWSGGSDTGSGIDGYSVSWSQNASETPDQVVDLQETAASTTSAALADGSWWFNLRTKDNAGNWTSTRHAGPFLIETAAPTNPTAAAENGGAVSGVWQNTVADPDFTWSGAGDAGASGVKGYYYYWGTNPSGTPTTWTASAAYNPPVVGGPGSYYLRVKTEDNAGNQSAPTTLFSFNYDNGAPLNPASATETGGASNNSWQNSVFDPNFTWSPGTDSVSGVKGYYYYWGPSSAGEPTTWTASADFDPPAVANPSTNYLRVKTEDNAGNQSAPATLFTFKYDNNVPSNPTSTIEAGGAISDVWQKTINDPDFVWSGASSGGGASPVHGYYYYWGPSAEGTSTNYTTGTTFDPPPVVNPSANYLRVRTKDGAGNQADWTTLFVFKYDAETPLDPAVTTSTPAPGFWANDNTIDIDWSGGGDGAGSGIDGYSVSWSQNTTEAPDQLLDLQESVASTTSPPLVDGVWWFNLRTRDNTGNWTSTVHEGPFRVDAGAPANPTSTTETGGALSDIWQNTVSDPNFTWSGAADGAGSGIKGYYYYWGVDSAGAPTTWTTSAAFDPPPVGGGGTYYLRVKTEDNVGNRSAAATLFTFNYDGDRPSAPGAIAELGGAQNDAWQRDVADPHFVWPDATDTASGVKGYHYYWGTSVAGTPTSWTATADFDPPAAASGRYYLKVRTEDQAGNLSTGMATFIFKYDGIAPVDPTPSSPSHTIGSWSTNNIVQISLAGGFDSDSLVQGYAVSWSQNTTELPGAVVNLAAPAVFTASPPLADGIWYFNLRTKDNAGNWTSTAHLGPFKIDTAGPAGGSLAINAGAANTNSTAVTLSLAAVDGASGPAQMQLANAGGPWSAWQPYATTMSWNLTSGSGDKTVYVKFKDAAGNESGTFSDSIRLDTSAPSATILSPAISTSVSKTKTFSLSWSGVDPAPMSGVASCDVQYKVGAGGAWTNWKMGTTVTSANFTGKPGKAYYFRVRAKDAAGNTGAWSTEPRTIVPFDQNSKIVKRIGFNGVLSKANSGNFLGTLRYSKTGGEEITYSGTGNYFALIADKGKGRGKIAVYVDGKLKKTVNTFAKSTKYRQVVYSIAFFKAGKHTLRIVNKGTAGRPRVNLDALAIGD